MMSTIIRGKSGASSGKHAPLVSRKSSHLQAFQFVAALLLGAWLIAWWYITNRLPIASSPVSELLGAIPTKSFCRRDKPPFVCAHGGIAKYVPANTFEAFRQAVQARVDCVEIDVARTQDNQLVVLHVRELSQLLQGSIGAQVSDLTWSDLQKLSWEGGHRVMLVKDAVLLTSPAVSTVILDLKPHLDQDGHPTDELVLAELVTQMLTLTACKNCLVYAKSDTLVAAVKAMRPQQPCGYVLMNHTAQARSLGMDRPLRMAAAEVVASYYGLATTRLLHSLHQNGKALFAWTVNEPTAIRAMLDVGVDAIVTNEPALVQQAVHNRLRTCAASSTRHLI